MRARIVAAFAALTLLAPVPHASARTRIGPYDWPMYGRSERHTFVGRTTLDATSVRTLAPRWFFRTGDIVSANPIVVAGTIYVGSWDGSFYAIDAKTGGQRWRYRVKDQLAISPQPGNRQITDITSDGGIITSSAVFARATRSHPDLVIFGGGYTLYALRAQSGRPFWIRDFTGRPDKPADPKHDPTRIMSSPVVVGNRVIFGVTPNGANTYRGYVAAADVRTGKPLWRVETDVDKKGPVLNDGCGGVWSSPTVIRSLGVAVFAGADCAFTNRKPFDEKVFAIRIATGKVAWVFDPGRVDAGCDWDFGATANLGLAKDGTPNFLGLGGKDGTYYSLDPRTGKLRWKRNVVFGGYSGGFIGTTAYDGKRVYGATAIGDFGRFEGVGDLGCTPGDPRDTAAQEPSMHAFDAKTGRIAWEGFLTPSLSATSVADGMTFVCAPLLPQDPVQRIDVREAATGVIIAAIPLPVGCLSVVVPSGNALFFGTGTSEEPQPAGVWAYTPTGEPVKN